MFAFVAALTNSIALAAEAEAPSREFDRIAQSFQKDAPSQELVDKIYAFMERYPADPRSDQAQFWVALTQQRRKFHNEAIKEFGFVIKDFPASPLVIRALRAQADSYLAIARPELAAENFARIVAMKPKEFSSDPPATAAFRDAAIYLADRHVERNEIDPAIALVLQLPDRADSLTRTVNLYIRADRHEEALNLVRRLPQGERFLGYRLSITAYSSRPGTANLFKLFDEILEREKPDDQVDALMRQLASAIGGKGADGKQKVFEQLVARYERLKRWAEHSLCEMHRTADLQRLLTFIGDYHSGADVETVKTWIGELHEARGEPDKAREAYWLLDNKPAAHLKVAETYYGPRARTRDLPGGEKELSEIVKRFYSPATSAEALTRRAELQAGPMQNVDAAIATLRELVERFSKEGNYPPRALMRIGALLRGQKKPDEAILAYERLILEYPDSPQHRPAWLQIAACHEEKEDPQRAIAIFKTIMRKFPRTREASHAHTRLETRYKIADTDVSDR